MFLAISVIVSSLEIDGFRNLRQIVLQCSPRFNLIAGENASGKTSLLEALYFLGRSRSFRTRQIRDLVHHEMSRFRIVARLQDELNGHRIPVGIEHGAGELSVRVAGAPAASLAQLASLAPVLLLNPDSHRLLDGGPRQRRRFMDWGAFHTEPAFLEAWRRYGTALRHRNAALKVQASNRYLDAWDDELGRSADILDRLRQDFCAALEIVLDPLIRTLLGSMKVSVEYYRGWNRAQDLSVLLHAGKDQDRRLGYTRCGPHRADFLVRIDGSSAAQRLSRGQQKLLVIALLLAQAKLYRRQRDDACILLIDDLPAELDRRHRDRVTACLAGMEVQIFVTAIEADSLDVTTWSEASFFKLEKGGIHPVSVRNTPA